MASNELTLDDILHGDQGKYGYLFPYRKRVPQIRKHIFDDLKTANTTVDKFVAKKMMDIRYIGWTAKVLLGIDLFPIQIAILQLMWDKPFPMLVACRGGSKSYVMAVYSILKAILDQGVRIAIIGAGLRQAKLVFAYIESIWKSSEVLRNIVGGGQKGGPRQNVDLCYFNVGDSVIYALPLGDGCLSPCAITTYENCFGTIADDHKSDRTDRDIICRNRGVWGNGKFRRTDESYCNGESQTKKIKTHHGFEIEGTHNHRLKVVRDQKITWTRMDEMRTGDRVLLDRSTRWHDGDCGITEDEAYAIGLLTGDGCFTQALDNKVRINRISFATQDRELANAVQIIGDFQQLRTDPVHWNLYNRHKCLDVLRKFGIDIGHLRTKDKQFPSTVLKSSRKVTSAFISGLFDSDGHIVAKVDGRPSGGMSVGVHFTNTSKELVRQLQYILLHYGIVAHVISRKRDDNWERCYELSITGNDVKIFAEEIGFRLKRKQDKLLAGISQKKRWMDQTDDIPDVLESMTDIAGNNRPKWGTGRCASVCAARLRDRKTASRPLVDNFLRVYGHIDDPCMDDIRCLADPDIYYDEIVSIEDSECVTYDIHVPDGHEYCGGGFYSHNTKIRGFRANIVVVDEFASVPEDVFDTVVRGFAATARTPVEEAKKAAFINDLRKLDVPEKVLTRIAAVNSTKGNQIIYSGTAYYAFNHFAKKYEMWKAIIQSRGDKDRIAEIFGGETAVPESFDHRDYAIIRLPHTHLPEGMLDKRQLAHAKATLPRNIYLMEYGGCFIRDSDGFFPRSLIEGCTVGPGRPIATPDGDITFTPLMRGAKGPKYVIGIDPAAERDNFAIVVLEVWPNHTRIVYCWFVNKPEFQKRKQQGLITDDDYYAYCCSKIRGVTKIFAPIRIEMDSQGGGYVVSEMLRNKKLMDVEDGDFPIYEVIDFDDPKPTDGETDGRHVLHLVKQTSDFNQEANVCVKKGFETRRLLFPAFDSVKMFSALETEKAEGIAFDTYEDCVYNIEELKNELCTIQMTATATGKEKFDTPTVVQAGAVEGRQRKGRLHKDRYTGLLLSYKYVYDTEVSFDDAIDYNDVAGNIEKGKRDKDMPLYRGPGVGRMRNAEVVRQGNNFGAIKRGKRLR